MTYVANVKPLSSSHPSAPKQINIHIAYIGGSGGDNNERNATPCVVTCITSPSRALWACLP